VDPAAIYENMLPETIKNRTVVVSNVGQLDMEYHITPFILTGKSGERDYCTASNGCDEYISNVALENINNTTGCDGYADYTDQVVTMMAGSAYNITVTNGTPYSGDYCGIWIDWNQNEVFDAEESVEVQGNPGYGPYTAAITPPPSALPGVTRMRIRIVYQEDPQPCGTSTYGETEDYSVSVVNWLDVDPTTGTVLPGETAEISLTLSSVGMALGTYTAELQISSNDPDNPMEVVPITMNVANLAVTVSSDPDSVCLGVPVQLTSALVGGSGSEVYSWTSVPEGFLSSEPNPVVTPEVSARYVLEVTDNDVTVSDSLDIVVFPLPVVALGDDLSVCAGDFVTVDAGAGFASYLWSTGETTQTITTAVAGEYWVEVSSAEGCLGYDTLAVIVNPLPVVALGSDTTLCFYHQIILDAGNAGSTYAWSTGETTRTITVDSTGMTAGTKTIKVDVTSAEGCMSADSISISFIECTGMPEQPSVRALQVYPNPGDGHFYVSAGTDKLSKARMTVVSATGAVVYSLDNVELVPGSRFEVNLMHLADGTYTLQLTTPETLYQARIIINKIK